MGMHAIGRKAAQEIGLSIQIPDEELENTMWKLYLEYEKLLKLNDPIDPLVTLKGKEEEQLKDIPIAIIESEYKSHIFNIQIDIKKRRQVPPNPQININLGFNLPPNIQPENIPQQIQQVIQEIMNQLAQEIQRRVKLEIVLQSPEVGIDIRTYGGKWQEYLEESKI